MSLDSTTRALYLREMGLAPVWKLREPQAAAAMAEACAPAPEVAADARPATAPAAVPGGSVSGVAREVANGVATLDWDALQDTVANCRACGLCQKRKQAVLGVGDLHPDWLFIGEGPGAEEDERGEPFVGQAGKLLDAMLAAIGLQRGRKVYIANTVKCRPPGNRTPEAAEMAACRPYLERQIALLKPRRIVLLGRAAVQSVLGDDRALAALRGKSFDYQGIPVVVTYHPAYLLRNLPDKAKAWEDLCFARRSERARSTPPQ